MLVLFFGSGVESRAGLSLTECQPPSRLAPSPPSSSSSSSSGVPQHVRKTCLHWTPRRRGASQRCPSRRNCSPREQQSQHSCGVTRIESMRAFKQESIPHLSLASSRHMVPALAAFIPAKHRPSLREPRQHCCWAVLAEKKAQKGERND
ncbi:hypothetical protein EYF80_039774 [Liparis tanakae]|uniref:Uncharacterized protein n=1 Tax=Liparis tanakae TaxID=230148 RepID=A0A4Z2GAQ1_9TELE|nr:hypothetical protein EYF80_039774 [Liparis tanakae]